MSRRLRVWLIGVGPEGLEFLDELLASGLTFLETVAADVEGPLLRRSPARRKVPLPRSFGRAAGAEVREAVRSPLAKTFGDGDLVLFVGDTAEEGPVPVLAEVIRSLGAHAVVLVLSPRRAPGPRAPGDSASAAVRGWIRAAVEGGDVPAGGTWALDRGSLLEVLVAADAELAGPDRQEETGSIPLRPPSRGEGSAFGGGSGGTEDPPPDSDRDLPGDPPSTEAPVDRVHFTVTAPARVRPGSFFVLDLWAHLDEQRDEVLERAREAAEGDLRSRSKGPVAVARGTMLTVRLRIDGLEVDEPEDTILWDGEIANASFPVYAPREVDPGETRGLATVHAGGLQVAKVHFALRVEAEAGESGTERLSGEAALHRRAFASYASADRDQVLGRIQGMQKIVPGLEVFLDVLTLRSGQDWAAELERVIPENDVFYLFWSEPASRSEWVEKEWRWALRSRGVEFIDPVPLVSPQLVPPPDELASHHFNDWVLAFMSGPKGPA